MNNQSYNGWTNWETWVVRCHLLDELIEAIQSESLERFETQEEFTDYVKGCSYDGIDSLLALEFLKNALESEVNWAELFDYMKTCLEVAE